MSTEENNNNNFSISIDPTFTNVNRLFVLAYDNDRQLFSRFYHQMLWSKIIMLLLIN